MESCIHQKRRSRTYIYIFILGVVYSNKMNVWDKLVDIIKKDTTRI